MATIEAVNLGPIEHFRFDAPPAGGMLIARGASGTGKSHLQNAVRSLGGNKDVALPVRDGAPHARPWS